QEAAPPARAPEGLAPPRGRGPGRCGSDGSPLRTSPRAAHPAAAPPHPSPDRRRTAGRVGPPTPLALLPGQGPVHRSRRVRDTPAAVQRPAAPSCTPPDPAAGPPVSPPPRRPALPARADAA